MVYGAEGQKGMHQPPSSELHISGRVQGFLSKGRFRSYNSIHHQGVSGYWVSNGIPNNTQT